MAEKASKFEFIMNQDRSDSVKQVVNPKKSLYSSLITLANRKRSNIQKGLPFYFPKNNLRISAATKKKQLDKAKPQDWFNYMVFEHEKLKTK